MGTAARWIRIDQDCPVARRIAVAGFARAQGPGAAPALCWAREGAEAYAYALVVPLKFVPGRPWRWCAWALAPSIATYRQFGERAYLDGDDLCLGGRRIAASQAAALGACAVISSSFLARLPCGSADWTERNVAEAFRARIEAQHGWQFDHSWPTQAERAAIDGALALADAG